MKKGIGLLLVIGALLAAILFAACDSESSASPGSSGAAAPAGAALASDNSGTQGISVSGEGRVSIEPDVALLGIGASAKAMTVGEANSKVQAAMARLLDSLKANGVVEKDIQTSQFSINPEYDYQYNPQKLTGYRVTHMLQVKVRDIDKAGKVIDDGVEAAGDLTQVSGVSFTIDELTALHSQARQQAMADAQTKADELARLAGVTLGKPTYISESAYTPYSQSYYGAQAMAAPATGGSTEISPGQMEVVVSVQVTYGIQ